MAGLPASFRHLCRQHADWIAHPQQTADRLLSILQIINWIFPTISMVVVVTIAIAMIKLVITNSQKLQACWDQVLNGWVESMSCSQEGYSICMTQSSCSLVSNSRFRLMTSKSYSVYA